MKKTGLSIAAGVILIIMAVLSVVGGIGGLACGGALGAVSGATSELGGALTEGMTAEQKAEFDKSMAEAQSQMGTGVGMIMALSALTLIFGVLYIICAVGVFGLKPWAVNLTLGVMGVGILYSIISAVLMSSFGVSTIISIALQGFIGYAVFASKDTGAPAAPAAPAAPVPPADAPPPAEG